MASMSSDCNYESTLERLDAPEIDDTLLMELLDESPYVEEDTQDERLRRVIQSLEAEIATFGNCPMAADQVVPSDLDGAGGDSGSGSFDWMEVEVESEAAVDESDTASWYLEVDDQLVEEYYGDMREYINSSSFIYINNGEEECIEHEEYGSLWD